MGENKLWAFNQLLIGKEYSFGKALNPSAIVTRRIRPIEGYSYSTPIEEIKMGEWPVPEAGATGIVTSVNPNYENSLVKSYEVKIRVGDSYEWTVLKYLPTPGLRYMSPEFNEFMKNNRMFIGPMGNGIGTSIDVAPPPPPGHEPIPWSRVVRYPSSSSPSPPAPQLIAQEYENRSSSSPSPSPPNSVANRSVAPRRGLLSGITPRLANVLKRQRAPPETGGGKRLHRTNRRKNRKRSTRRRR